MDIERECINRLIKGSYKDFTYLYNLYAPRLYAFAFSMSSSESISKDIVQETFIKIWVNREDINPDKSFKSFLFTLVRNQLLNEFRDNINRQASFDDDSLLEQPSDYNAESILTINNFNKELVKAKKKLSPRQREFFELNKEYGLSVAEIASKTSVSEQSVRNQISQALSRLRKELKDYFYLFSSLFV